MKIDRAELALRMLEAAVGMRRPASLTIDEAMAAAPPQVRDSYTRASVAAVQYFIECAGPMMILNPTVPADDRSSIHKTEH